MCLLASHCIGLSVTCLFGCPPVCLPAHLSFCLSSCLSLLIWLSVFLSVSVGLSACLSSCHLSFCLSSCLSVFSPVVSLTSDLSFCLSPFVILSVCPSSHPSVYLCIFNVHKHIGRLHIIVVLFSNNSLLFFTL